MKLYKIILATSATSSTLELFVVADNPSRAEELALKACKKWEYTYEFASHITRLASVGQYGKPEILLMEGIEP